MGARPGPRRLSLSDKLSCWWFRRHVPPVLAPPVLAPPGGQSPCGFLLIVSAIDGVVEQGPQEGRGQSADGNHPAPQAWLKAGRSYRTRRSWGVGVGTGPSVALEGGWRMGGAS